MRILLIGLIAPLMMVLSCGSSDAPVEVMPIDPILAAPIAVSEITPNSAVVQVETTLDVICSVVYGLDTSYGQQSTDLDMAGRGHGTHSAVLRGLEPGMVYHYRLQGTGPDGALYVSEDMTFETPAGSGEVERTNLASLSQGARIVEVSSQFGGSEAWRPENAIDGDPNTEWSSAGDGDAAFITVELAQRSEIGSLSIWTRSMATNAQITSFKVILDDGGELGPFDLPDGRRMYDFEVSARSQTLRFEVVSSSGGNTGLIELGVFAPR